MRPSHVHAHRDRGVPGPGRESPTETVGPGAAFDTAPQHQRAPPAFQRWPAVLLTAGLPVQGDVELP